MTKNAFNGDYSPEGGSIVYTEALVVDGEYATGDLYIARPDGSDARALVEDTVEFARWSPCGVHSRLRCSRRHSPTRA